MSGSEEEDVEWSMLGLMRLAAMVYRSGVRERDEKFLESEWAKELKDAVVEWSQAQLKRSPITTLPRETLSHLR